jgi:hypothetical protein
MNLRWQLYQGNWWLAYGSTWVGYYPGSLYDVGSVPGSTSINTSANLIEFGGETVNGWVYYPPYWIQDWPQMGNGYDGESPSLAAQQNTIYYQSTTNGGTTWSSLTAANDTYLSCYTSLVSGWTLIFGGWGGAGFC